MKIEKNQAEWRRRRQQWSQHGRDVASVREDPVTDRDHPTPPARLNRSVDFELTGARTTTAETTHVVPAAAAAAVAAPATQQHAGSRSTFLGRSGTVSCRVHLLDGEEITVEVEVILSLSLSLFVLMAIFQVDLR